MEFIFNDYNNFKAENEQLLFELIDSKSDIFYRFKHVYDVTELLDGKMDKDGHIEEEEKVIFEMGFNYLYDQIQNIKIINDEFFKNDVDEMEKYSGLINLYLYSLDFQNEYADSEGYNKDYDKILTEYSDKVFDLIKNKGVDSKELHDELDNIGILLFGGDYYGVNEIFIDIANEYGILEYE